MSVLCVSSIKMWRERTNCEAQESREPPTY
jgi:hypothetical protein